ELGSKLCGGPKETGGSFCLFTYEPKTLTQAINGHVPNAISEGTAKVVTVTKAEMEKVTATGGAYFTGIIVSVVVIAHNKNKSYTTIHTPITTSRVLIECNVYIPNYDNDPDMNSVRENFHKKTEQRFHEYDKRMIKNRQKRKEKCDKDIQKIILKDKMEKSLSEKVEKVCLKCGYGLGGVATSVGVLGTAVVNVLKTAAIDVAIETALADGVVKGAAKGTAAGINTLIQGIKSEFLMDRLGGKLLATFFDATNYTKETLISQAVHFEYRMTCAPSLGAINVDKPMCTALQKLGLVPHNIPQISTPDSIKKVVETMISNATRTAKAAAETATEKVTAAGIQSNIAEVSATYTSYQIAIIASVVAILVIVLVMVIIFLILRYRRKKKLNEKQQYTKLLNQ
ncbi:hypothetical protein PFTANZ_06320, partial [Plasmodium falciparum Tanzania (2000708)]